MNMLDLQDKLKGLSEQQLVQAMQAPTENVPQFLVLSEITRRKRMRDSMQQQPDNTTVAQEAVAAAGVPQGGIADMAQALAPKTDMTQNTGVSPVQGMYGGGYVQKMQAGSSVNSKSLVPYSQQNFPSALASDPAVIAMAHRMGVSVEEYIASLPPDVRAKNIQRVLGGRIVPEISQGNQEQELPSQADLDARYRMSQAQQPRFAPDPTAPESGGLASLSEPMYPLMPDGNPIPGEEPPFYTPPDRLQPMSPMERLRAETDYMRSGEGLPAYNEFRDVFDAREAPDADRGPKSNRQMAFEEAQSRGDQNILSGAVNDIFYGLSGETVEDYEARKADEAASAPKEDIEVGPAFEQRGREQSPTDALEAIAAQTEAAKASEEAAKKAAANDIIASDKPSGPGGGGAGSASGATSYEQELINAMQRAERRAEQDKWLALAQVGLGLMSSTQPTLGGALGEAGLAGLQSYQGARDEYETERLGLSKELSGIASARASQQAAAAKARSGPSLQNLIDARDALYTKSTNELGEDVVAPIPGSEGEIAQINAAIRSMVGSMAAPTM